MGGQADMSTDPAIGAAAVWALYRGTSTVCELQPKVTVVPTTCQAPEWLAGGQSRTWDNARGAARRSCPLLQHMGTTGVDPDLPYYLANSLWIHLFHFMNLINGVLAGVTEIARLA